MIDARMVRGTLHGIARYAYCLTEGIARARPDWTIGVWTHAPELWRSMPNVLPCRVEARPFSLREQWELPRSAANFRPDLIHFPSIAVPLWLAKGSLITVHDLIPYRYPPTPVHRPYLKHVFSRLARRSAGIVCGSQHSRQDVEELLGVPRQHIHVVAYGGLDGPVSLDEVQTQPRNGRPFFLCVSNPRPHKNLRVLLEAYRGLESHFDLVLVSPSAPWLDDALQGRKCIQRIHGISDSALRELYRGALGVVVPSLYEGFGLPVLEAMQLGTAVICSNATSLPEVAGEAALLFDPHSSEQLRARLLELGHDPVLRAELLVRGERQAALFSWQRCVDGHLKIYESLHT